MGVAFKESHTELRTKEGQESFFSTYNRKLYGAFENEKKTKGKVQFYLEIYIITLYTNYILYLYYVFS